MEEYIWLDELEATYEELYLLRTAAETKERERKCTTDCPARIGVPCIRTNSCPKIQEGGMT